MLCLSVCLVLYCPYYLRTTSGGQAGNKEQDRQTDKQSIKFKEEAIICCKEKKITFPPNEWRITFHFKNKTKENERQIKMSHLNSPSNFAVQPVHLSHMLSDCPILQMDRCLYPDTEHHFGHECPVIGFGN